jgi:hypothetical protein
VDELTAVLTILVVIAILFEIARRAGHTPKWPE